MPSKRHRKRRRKRQRRRENAVEKGKKQESNIVEHPGDGESGPPPETSSSRSYEESWEKEEKVSSFLVHWKTTTCGLVAGVLQLMIQYNIGNAGIEQGFKALALALLGYAAADASKTVTK